MQVSKERRCVSVLKRALYVPLARCQSQYLCVKCFSLVFSRR